jgi:hypothetical protein
MTPSINSKTDFMRFTAAWLIILVVGLSCSACRNSKVKTARPLEKHFLVVGYVLSTQVIISGELSDLLATNGIDVEFEGSHIYDFYVRKDQISRAMGILQTNHLVLEGKVVLYSPERAHNGSEADKDATHKR